jgi:hypothetical protein
MNGWRRSLLWAGAAAMCLPGGGCIASNVVAPEQRLVSRNPAALPFAVPAAAQLDGLYESIEISGDAAVSLRKVYYCFGRDGVYTAAALTEAEGVQSFQTLNGSWAFGARGLSLDQAEPVLLEAANDHLRLTAASGVLVLRRVVE